MKQLIQYLIQGPFTLIRYFQKSIFINIVRTGKKIGEHTFGYYDKSPWNKEGTNMVILRIPYSNRMPEIGTEKAVIELLDGNGVYIKDIASCRIWNTQMANRLQWVGPEFNDKIIYNDYRNDKLVSVIKNINNDKEVVLKQPIYDVSPDGKFAIRLNFLRLHIFRSGYGYNIGQNRSDYQNIPSDDGIFFLDLINNEEKLLISLLSLAKKESSDLKSMHSVKVNHLMINKSSSRFMFLFRYMIDDKKFTRLYTISVDGQNLFLFNTRNLVSHANWVTENTFIVWADVSPKGQAYYLFSDFNAEPIRIIGKNVLKGDGHPSVSLDGNFLLTDTYSDIARRKRLILYDIIANNRKVLGKFYNPFVYSGSLRCDLHPRFDFRSKKICFDAVFKNGRQVYISKI
jgi:hypothetical protein